MRATGTVTIQSAAGVRFDGVETWYTVVGIAGNIRQYRLNREAIAQAYLPLARTPFGFGGSLLVRATGNPIALAGSVRDAVHSMIPICRWRT